MVTGHDDGIITVDLAEGDDVHREQMRVTMDEPYRTLLGHFRHEVGHYYFFRLVEAGRNTRMLSAVVRRSRRRLPGGPRPALPAGAPAGWEERFVSGYATMHAAEDWAETFAHYLHIRSTLDTAAAYGLAPATGTYQRKVLGPSAFDTIIIAMYCRWPGR